MGCYWDLEERAVISMMLGDAVLVVVMDQMWVKLAVDSKSAYELHIE